MASLTPAELTIRLSLAHAFAQMLLKAYDALQAHGIDYRKLPSYADEARLDAARTLPIHEGQVAFMDWMGRIERDIAAAIRRKQMKVTK
jgi:hypothetical protein